MGNDDVRGANCFFFSLIGMLKNEGWLGLLDGAVTNMNEFLKV